MAGRIPQPFIDDLLSRVDIVDVIDAYTTLKKAGKNYKGLCPFHSEKTPSFSVEPDKLLLLWLWCRRQCPGFPDELRKPGLRGSH